MGEGGLYSDNVPWTLVRWRWVCWQRDWARSSQAETASVETVSARM